MTGHVLTKATLAPAAHNIGALLAETSSVDGGHRLLWTLFPSDREARKKRDFLFRKVDDRTYYIVSPTTPVDMHRLWRLGPKPYAPKPMAGERYSFILRANPAISISQGNRQSIRADAVMHAKRTAKRDGKPWGRDEEAEAALAWLYKRDEAIGVRFDRENCHTLNYVQATLPHKNGESVEFSTVDYEGAFEVTDAGRLMTALFNGIGKAKAFGCGLMLIRRL